MKLAIILVLWPALVFAKPRVAVAPLDNDNDGTIVGLVHEAAAAVAKVTSSKTVAKTLKELKIKDPDSAHAAKQLRKRLEVDAVVYGKVDRTGGKKTLKLSVYTRGKKPDHFEIEYKQASSKAFREKLRDELADRLAPNEDTQEDADETASARKHAADPDVPDRPERPDRNGITQASAYADAGIGGVRRTLTYEASTGGTTPPRVGTGAFGFQFDGEIYPASFSTLEGPAAALGVFASLNDALGLSISIPGATQSAAIEETSYAIGVRYRFVFGDSSIAAGLGYWGESYIADRSTLTSPTQLNMPDTNYKAIGPDALLRLAVTSSIGAIVQVDLPLMLSSGPITDPNYFGLASVSAFALKIGADVAIDRHFGLHFIGYFNQESLSFKQGMVSSATDRTMGASAMLALMY